MQLKRTRLSLVGWKLSSCARHKFLLVNNLKLQSEYIEYLQSEFLDLKREITSLIQCNRLLMEIQFVLIR